MAITTKQEFINYCLRQLGAPMIAIELHPDNLTDAYDDAVRAFTDAHFDGFEKLYLKHQLTQLDIDNGYIVLPPSIIGVANVFPMSSSSSSGSNYLIDPIYHITASTIFDLSSGGGGLAYYTELRQYLNMMQTLLVGQPMFRFNRVMDKVYIDMGKSKLTVGSYILVECSKALVPEEYPEIWLDPWFKQYATALMKKTWGSQLKKFNNIQTIGGVAVDGQTIYNEAIQEIDSLKQELVDVYSLPVNFLVG